MTIQEKNIIEIIRDVTGTHKEINPYDSLVYDIGMTSFEMCMLACELEIKGCKNVDYKKFNHATTIKDLCNLL